MSEQHPRPIIWAHRPFHFPEDVSEMPSQMLHLKTFPSHLALTLREISKDKLTTRQDGKWSIQEHLGHLIDLEDLPTLRVKEILQGKDTLTPADMSNKNTWDKNYNEKNLYGLCESFIERRNKLVKLLAGFSDSQLLKWTYHERLHRNMSILDLTYFQCQHDHYHHEMIMHLASS